MTPRHIILHCCQVILTLTPLWIFTTISQSSDAGLISIFLLPDYCICLSKLSDCPLHSTYSHSGVRTSIVCFPNLNQRAELNSIRSQDRIRTYIFQRLLVEYFPKLNHLTKYEGWKLSAFYEQSQPEPSIPLFIFREWVLLHNIWTIGSQNRIWTYMMNLERISLYFLFHLLCLASTNSATWLICVTKLQIHFLISKHFIKFFLLSHSDSNRDFIVRSDRF